jgi:hypothetical protein
MPVRQLDTGAAFKEQRATSEVVAPVMVIPVCAWLVPAAMAVPAVIPAAQFIAEGQTFHVGLSTSAYF